MADILFSCGACEQELVADESGIGITIRCPRCGEGVKVPDKAAHGIIRVREVDTLKARTRQLDEMLAAVHKELADARSAASSERQRTAQSAARIAASFVGPDGHSQDAFENLDLIEKTIAEHLQRLGNAEIDRQQLRAKFAETVGELKRAREAASAGQSQIEELSKQLEASRRESSAARQTFTHLQTKRDELSQKLSASMQEVAELREKVARHEQQGDPRAEIRRMAEELGKTLHLLREKTSALAVAESDKQHLKEKLTAAEAELAQSRQSGEASENRYSEAKAALAASHERIRQAEKDREQFRALHAAAAETLSRLSPAHDSLRAEHEKLASQLQDLNAELARAERKTAAAISERDTASLEFDEARKDIAAQSSKIREMEAHTERLANELRDTRNALTGTETKLYHSITDREGLQTMLRGIRANLDGTSGMYATMTATVDELERELQNTAHALDEARRQIESAEAAVEEARCRDDIEEPAAAPAAGSMA